MPNSFGKTLIGFSLLAGVFSKIPVVFAKGSGTPSLPSDSSNGPLVGMFISMLIVIALGWLVLRLLLKRFNIKTRGDVDLIAVRQVAPNRYVGVVDVYGRKYVVGIGDTVTCLDRLGEIDVSTHPNESQGVPVHTGSSIKKTLERLRRDYGRPRREDNP